MFPQFPFALKQTHPSLREDPRFACVSRFLLKFAMGWETCKHMCLQRQGLPSIDELIMLFDIESTTLQGVAMRALLHNLRVSPLPLYSRVTTFAPHNHRRK